MTTTQRSGLYAEIDRLTAEKEAAEARLRELEAPLSPDWSKDAANFEKLRQNFTTNFLKHGATMTLPAMSEALVQVRERAEAAEAERDAIGEMCAKVAEDWWHRIGHGTPQDEIRAAFPTDAQEKPRQSYREWVEAQWRGGTP